MSAQTLNIFTEKIDPFFYHMTMELSKFYVTCSIESHMRQF